MLTVLERMIKAGAEVQGFKPDGLKLDTALRDEEAHGLDSIGRVEYILALESEFATELPEDLIDSMATMGDLARHLATLPQQAAT